MNAAMFSGVTDGGQAKRKGAGGDVGKLGQVGLVGRGDVNGQGSTVAVLPAAKCSTAPGARRFSG